MTAVETPAGAPTYGAVDWNTINWKQAHRDVRRLQARIVKAMKEGRRGKVKALQWLLTHSFSGKALAVRRVTENRGKRTPGVDGEIWDTPRKKAQGIQTLRQRGYRAQPLRRTYIPKKNGKRRPLGIPTMRDRAMQALYKLALDPIAETTGDPNSYGFRRERSPADAIAQCFQCFRQKTSPTAIYEGDIEGCFDHISHEWLLDFCSDISEYWTFTATSVIIASLTRAARDAAASADPLKSNMKGTQRTSWPSIRGGTMRQCTGTLPWWPPV